MLHNNYRVLLAPGGLTFVQHNQWDIKFPRLPFAMLFRAHHIPTGVMEIQLEQFVKLQQGNMIVQEYLAQFNHLSQYAPEHVSTDA